MLGLCTFIYCKTKERTSHGYEIICHPNKKPWFLVILYETVRHGHLVIILNKAFIQKLYLLNLCVDWNTYRRKFGSIWGGRESKCRISGKSGRSHSTCFRFTLSSSNGYLSFAHKIERKFNRKSIRCQAIWGYRLGMYTMYCTSLSLILKQRHIFLH